MWGEFAFGFSTFFNGMIFTTDAIKGLRVSLAKEVEARAISFALESG